MSGEQIWGVIRTLLAFGGGFIVSKGYIDDATLTAVIGALGTIFIAGWSVWAKAKPSA
jgi:O-antigen/teichoic acid export membrane protein